MRLAIMCGLPRSGKTTCAKRLQDKGWVRLCPDDVRLALHGKAFVGTAEPTVWATAELAARALLLSGHKVVIDATNTTKERRARWVRLAHDFDETLVAYVVRTTAEECHRINEECLPSLPGHVIDRMAQSWEPVTESEGIGVVYVGRDGDA